LLQPTSGTATIAGHDVERRAGVQVRADVGFLAASTALYGRLTAREMITYFGRAQRAWGTTPSSARIQQLADELDMHEFLDRRLRQVLHRHEAEDLHRPHAHPRSSGDDL
jgi:sodium transport system ATP-binding protein